MQMHSITTANHVRTHIQRWRVAKNYQCIHRRQEKMCLRAVNCYEQKNYLLFMTVGGCTCKSQV